MGRKWPGLRSPGPAASPPRPPSGPGLPAGAEGREEFQEQRKQLSTPSPGAEHRNRSQRALCPPDNAGIRNSSSQILLLQFTASSGGGRDQPSFKEWDASHRKVSHANVYEKNKTKTATTPPNTSSPRPSALKTVPPTAVGIRGHIATTKSMCLSRWRGTSGQERSSLGHPPSQARNGGAEMQGTGSRGRMMDISLRYIPGEQSPLF